MKTNREASLLVEHSGIAAYFGEDVRRGLAHERAGPVPPGTVTLGGEDVRPASEFAQGGVVMSRARDYLDV